MDSDMLIHPDILDGADGDVMVPPLHLEPLTLPPAPPNIRICLACGIAFAPGRWGNPNCCPACSQ